MSIEQPLTNTLHDLKYSLYIPCLFRSEGKEESHSVSEHRYRYLKQKG
jgi:hypothetical protein